MPTVYYILVSLSLSLSPLSPLSLSPPPPPLSLPPPSLSLSLSLPLSLYSPQLLPVSRLSISSPFLIPSDFSRSYHILYSDSSAVMLAGLSVLELCLVIAAKNLTQLSGGEPFNFEMVYSGTYNYIYTTADQCGSREQYSVVCISVRMIHSRIL